MQAKQSNKAFREDLPNMMLLIFLYIIQGIPMGLIGGAIPLVLKDKYSYTEIGYVSLAIYPFSFKVLWSPLVDTYFIPSCGRRRSWIIPTQFLSGILCLWISQHIAYLIEDSQHAKLLAALLMIVVFLLATQDIAVDSWGLTLLKKENQSYAASCQSMGLGLGYFVSTTIFLVLNDPQFCNKYLNSVPSAQPILTLDFYFQLLGGMILTSTGYILFFKKQSSRPQEKNKDQSSQPSAIHEEEHLSLKEVMVLALKLKDHAHVRGYIGLLLICKLGNSFISAVGSLYLLELGYSQSTFAAMEVIHLPLELYFGYLSGVLGKTKQMTQFIRIISLQHIADIIFIVFVSLGGPSSSNFKLVFIILIITLTHMSHQLEFGIRASFHRKIADKRIGATYLTLINCVTNLSFLWPKLFVYKMMDTFGFFPSSIFMNAIGWVIIMATRKSFIALDAVPEEEWSLK